MSSKGPKVSVNCFVPLLWQIPFETAAVIKTHIIKLWVIGQGGEEQGWRKIWDGKKKKEDKMGEGKKAKFTRRDVKRGRNKGRERRRRFVCACMRVCVFQALGGGGSDSP